MKTIKENWWILCVVAILALQVYGMINHLGMYK